MSARPTYGSGDRAPSLGAWVSEVDRDGPADRAGIVPGERIVSANGHILRDVIDWRWESDGASVAVEVASGRGTRSVLMERGPGEQWGVDFADPVFDGVRTCRNACTFCFMAQLPRGLRPALYVRDDDFRLSFLQGNFVTLTNLNDSDVDRIAEQRLSPLYVSLHAVTPDVRSRLLCPREDRALEFFDEILAAGIDIHVQIVLVPGVNDGAELQLTLGWLAERHGVVSVGVVPLGYTGHQERFSSSYESPVRSAEVLDLIEPWRSAFRERDGVSWVHSADEFYLNAGRPVPPAEFYDGYPQLENGVGLVRSFYDTFDTAIKQVRLGPATDADPRTIVVTGELFAPVLKEVFADHGLDRRAGVLAVPNTFFGGNVSVAGLLTGTDVAAAIRSHGARGPYLVPSVLFNDDGRTLDDMTLDEVARAAGAPVHSADADGHALLSAIL